jgi:ABC-2 type transport system permease protein
MTGLAGTGALVRLMLRRDRVRLPVWILVFVAVAASSTSATVGLYPTLAGRVQAAATVNNTPALVALYGAVADPTSLGAISIVKLAALGSAMVAVLGMLTVVRHTRAEEESGRLELLGATVVGRQAPLTAALLVAVLANLALGVLTALGQIGAGLPAAGSFAFGLSWSGAGIAFAGIAALVAQLTSSARTANGITAGVLGVAYLLRAVGDTAPAGGVRWLSWLSPIGWAQLVHAYAGDRWWLLALPVALAVVAAGAAYRLAARRDLGAGLLPDRPGPATAARWLASPLALAWRLQRGSVLVWAAAFLLLGAVLGNIASSVTGMLDSPQARDMILQLGGVQGLTDAFLATELGFVGIFAAAFGVSSAMRLRAEETGQRAEPVLAGAVGRTRYAASHLVVALAGSAVLVLAAGVGAALTRAAHTGDTAEWGRLLAAAAVQIPAAWVLVGIVVAVFGWAPRGTMAGWAALVVFVLIGEFGPLLKLEQWARDVSPFAHVPRLPGGEFTATPLVWLVAVTAVLVVAGLVGFRRRDLG